MIELDIETLEGNEYLVQFDYFIDDNQVYSDNVEVYLIKDGHVTDELLDENHIDMKFVEKQIEDYLSNNSSDLIEDARSSYGDYLYDSWSEDI